MKKILKDLESVMYKTMIVVTVGMVLVAGYIVTKGTQIEARTKPEEVVSGEWHVLLKDEPIEINEEGIPDFKDRRIGEFEDWAKENEIIYTIEYEYSDDVKKDRIIVQQNDEGEDIVVLVSKGIDYSVEVVLPKFSGMTVEQIQAFVKKNHMNGVTYTYVYDDNIAAGKFISSSTSKNKVKRSDKIVITISLGKSQEQKSDGGSKPVPKVTIPTFTSETQATTWASNNGFTIGTITRQYSNDYASGTIYNQSPAANSSHQAGTITISFTVSLGKPNIPNFGGMDVATARSSLTTINNSGGNISISESSEHSDSVAAGKIIRQSATGPVNIGTTVNVVVSLGPTPIVYVTLVSYNGWNYEVAKDAINGIEGLTAVDDGSCDAMNATVVDQSPGSGQVVFGTTVVLKCVIE